MGIHDGDYMKGSKTSPSSTDEHVEEFLSGFVQKHKRGLRIVAVILGLLIIAGIIMSML